MIIQFFSPRKNYTVHNKKGPDNIINLKTTSFHAFSALLFLFSLADVPGCPPIACEEEESNKLAAIAAFKSSSSSSGKFSTSTYCPRVVLEAELHDFVILSASSGDNHCP